MGIIKVEDVEYVRFAAPDLKEMRSFLLDFGLFEVGPADQHILRMRGTGSAQVVHETVLGDAGFAAVALRAASMEDLERFATSEHVAIEAADGPGGGSKIVLTDPNGYRVEVIAGRTPADPLQHGTRASWNTMADRGRHDAAKRIDPGPASVVRLGHVVLGAHDMVETWEWWSSHFGLIMSDEVRAPDGTLVAGFLRCDRGRDPADHHSLNFAAIPGKAPAFHHAAFEVADLDDLMAGHEHLKLQGRAHDWGVGRHVLGSQVFDYWKDPFGHRVEHWTDGDLFTADVPTNVTDVPTMLSHQWGPGAPGDFA